jgi:hypothetical protein
VMFMPQLKSNIIIIYISLSANKLLTWRMIFGYTHVSGKRLNLAV